MLTSKPLLVSAVVIAALFAVYFAFFSPQYESIDDVQMAMTASGTVMATVPDARIHFSNVLIGRILMQLYLHNPDIAWYGIYLLTVHATLHVTLLYSILLVCPCWQRIWLYCVYFLTLGIYFLNHLQFTSTAILTAISGVFLIVATGQRLQLQCRLVRSPQSEANAIARQEPGNANDPRFVWARCIVGISLVVLASLIRSYGLLFSLILVGPLVLHALFWRSGRACGRVVIASLGIGMILSVAAYLYDASPAGRGADWWSKEHTRRLALRFVDYNAVPYNKQTRPLFDGVGWTRNDFEMLMQYGYLDQQRFSKEKLQAVLSQYPEHTSFDLKRWAVGLLGTVYTAALAPQLLFGALVVFSVMIGHRGPRTDRVVLFASAVLSIVVLFALLDYTHRVPPWVFYSAASYPMLLAILQYRPDGNCPSGPQARSRRWSCSGVALLAGLGAAWPIYDNWQTFTGLQAKCSEFQEDIRNLKPRPDQLFVLSINNEWTSPVLKVPGGFEAFHVFYIGPPQLTPAGQRVLRRFQIDDPFKAAYENSKVFLIGTPQFNRVYRQYVKEHYGTEVGFRVYFQGRRITVYDVFPQARRQLPAESLPLTS